MDNNYFSTNIEHMTDKIQQGWFPVVLESMHDTIPSGRELERNYIESYLKTAEAVEKTIEDQHSSFTTSTTSANIEIHDYSVPFFFLCKHVIELSIKYYLRGEGLKFEKTHELEKLWLQIPNKKLQDADKNLLDLIRSLDRIDRCRQPHKSGEKRNNGQVLRYSFDVNENENLNGLLLFNCREIIKGTNEIYRLLVQRD